MNANSERAALLKRIMQVDFALTDTVLYLDAYPDNAEALAYYNELKLKNDALRAEYQASYGPLTIYNNESDAKWQWTSSPWPWEYESN